MAIILLVYTVSTAIGPWVGGEIIATTTTWRWVFYINLPVSTHLPLTLQVNFAEAHPSRSAAQPW
jgi:MFS family permease